MPGHRVTIAEIAATAGVSVPTVSKVLNGRADVSESTRRRVQQIMADRGYQRRASGAQRPVGLIDMAVPGLDSPWVVDVLRGAEAEAHKVGSQIVLTTTGRAPAGDRRWLDRLATRRSDGLVLVVSEAAPEAVEQLAALHTPVVLLDPVGGSDPSFATVGATNWAGGLSAVEHLVSLGHRRIAVLSGPPQLVCSQERVEGYRAALGRAGIAVDERLVRFTDFCTSGGRDGARTVLDLPDPPTAVFACSDVPAAHHGAPTAGPDGGRSGPAPARRGRPDARPAAARGVGDPPGRAREHRAGTSIEAYSCLLASNYTEGTWQ
jgi:DNA-binding LacI/PurR family transcriptional regulator